MLEKVSQPRDLRFHSNKYYFLKLELKVPSKNRSEPVRALSGSYLTAGNAVYDKFFISLK